MRPSDLVPWTQRAEAFIREHGKLPHGLTVKRVRPKAGRKGLALLPSKVHAGGLGRGHSKSRTFGAGCSCSSKHGAFCMPRSVTVQLSEVVAQGRVGLSEETDGMTRQFWFM